MSSHILPIGTLFHVGALDIMLGTHKKVVA